MTSTTSRRLSLLKPTGHLTLGNYLGALRSMALPPSPPAPLPPSPPAPLPPIHPAPLPPIHPLAAAPHHATCFFGIADLHALTVAHDPARLRALVNEMQVLLLACGIDPSRATLFVQSHVPAHSELAYLLECTAHTGELSRMIQFKEKRRRDGLSNGTRVSLYTYPVLMAADILLYRATEVPVGDDQRQHVELTRDLALRFNKAYGEVFTVPQITTPETGARVMDLQDPTGKMGKSHSNGAGIIYLLDDTDTVAKKVARAVTDSDTGPGAVRHDPVGKPGVSNLLEIIAGCSGRSLDEAAAGPTSYGDLKKRTTEAVLDVLAPIRKRYDELTADRSHVAKVYAEGAARCVEETAPVLAAARSAMGLA